MHAREISRACILLEFNACIKLAMRQSKMYLRCQCPYHKQNHKTMYYRESWTDGPWKRKTKYVVIGIICLTCNLVVLEGERNAQTSLPES